VTTETDLLWRLAELAGVARTYRDAFGVGFDPGEESIRAVLSGLGFSLETRTELEDTLKEFEAHQSRLIAGLIPCVSEQPTHIPLRQGIATSPVDRITWRTVLESGKVFEGIAPVTYEGGQGFFDLPPCPAGYHQLFAESDHRSGKALLIAAPPCCYMPPAFVQGARGFGLAAQVYGLKSECDFGMGDLSSVAALGEASARYGADFLGLSPLHALFSADRTKFSPYSPSSRLFIDPIFIDPCVVAAFEESGAKDYLAHPDQMHVLSELRAAPLVDHASVWTMKRQVLAELWRHFTQGPDQEFEAFRRAGGEALELHATFEALSHKFRDEGLLWLGEWPQEFRDVHSSAVKHYREEKAADIAFHAWLQWLADKQLAKAQRRACAGGMKLGLYRDLAVGADRGGSEVWASPHRFATRLSVGAPPDPLGPQGQDWGLPPLHPLMLEADGLAGFRALVAANMRHAGALRIDHAFQLRRLFVIPLGMPAKLGTYVNYPFDAMLAVLRLESHRAGAVVIAEDLGTAPENFSDAIMQAGILSYRVMPFEREANGTFKRPSTYPPEAIATFSTHDLPTFAGWWKGVDIGLREQFGIYDAQTVVHERTQREEDIRQFCASLCAEGLLPSAEVPAAPPFEEAMRYLARTQCRLVAVQCEDVSSEINQANLPGHDFGHPNWRRKLSNQIGDLTKTGGPFAKIAALIKAEREKVVQAVKTEGHGPAGETAPQQAGIKGAGMRKKKSKSKDKIQAANDVDFTLPTGEGRVIIETVQPDVDAGRHRPKRVVGDSVEVTAQIFTDGHEKIAADVLYRAADDPNWRRAPMHHLGNDQWAGSFMISAMVEHEFTVAAWRDPFASLIDGMKKKRAAGQNLRIESLEALALIDQAQSEDADLRTARQQLLNDVAGVEEGTPEKLDRLLSDETLALMAQIGPRHNVSRYDRDIQLRIERRKANFSAWYELFPRSVTDTPMHHGTFRDVIAHLPYVHELGFDVLYFPPIHPIGETNRRGRNNTLTPSEDDPGSVYAVGSEAGGHDAIHPQLGMIEDFRALIRAARDYDIEIALDFAIQCSPDHPWIRQHPEWFAWRPDGTIQFAENPPKKYEDIVNVDFYNDGLPSLSLWLALKDIITFWVREGVRIFRVDNPHTKPVPFWEWLIAEINRDDPDVIFLAEAFTRPAMMKQLAKIGFQQSYTYFTWRNTKQEIMSYIEELSGEMANYYRPNFFVNTPDINPYYLQTSGRAGYVVRSTLAATLASNWGLYSGFELCEGNALPGKEEYVNSEKYEIRPWDYDRPGNIREHVAKLNKIRRDNPALHDFRHCLFLNAWNDAILAYARYTSDRSSFVMVIVNLDPHNRQDCTYEVPLWEFGLPDQASIGAEDLLNGGTFTLYGKTHQIALDPAERSAVIWSLFLPSPEVARD